VEFSFRDDMTKKGRIIILSGPSGSGKTTLSRLLLKDPAMKGKIVRSVSVTTRTKRPGEKEGRDYYFISRKCFLYKQKAGHLLEAQKVYKDYYGTPAKPVREAIARGAYVLLCIEIKGSAVVKRKIPESLRIFIQPPSREALKKRLLQRGTENKAEISKRLQRVALELSEARKYDYVLINKDLFKCFNTLKAVLVKEMALS